MLKENVDDYFEIKEYLEKEKALLSTLKEKFDNDNRELIVTIEELKHRLDICSEAVTKEALEEFDGVNKKLYGGIGIQERKTLTYDEDKAFAFAKEKDMFLQLDVKAFEKVAGSLNLDFVTKDKVFTVTFPKEKKA